MVERRSRMAKIYALCIAIAVIFIAALLRFPDPTDQAWHRSDAKASPSAEKRDLPASSVLRIDPRVAHAPPATAAVKATPAPDPVIAQLRSRTGWAPLYQRLVAGPPTPESLYAQAEIYNRCARRPPNPARPKQTDAEGRESYVASIRGQPNFEQRLAAYDKVNANPCEGLSLGEFSKEEFERLLNAAAAAGDVRAQAWQLNQQVFEASNGRPGGQVITDEQVQAIRRMLASRDPGVVGDLQGLLASSVVDGTWRIGGIDERLDERALYASLTLVACDLGGACGLDSRQLLNECSMNGYCGATNLYDHTYFYESSPNQAQLMDRYRRAFDEAIASGDLSSLRLVREPMQRGRQYMFGGMGGRP